MAHFTVLGSTGMIGTTVTKYLTERGHFVLEVNRSGGSQGGNPVIKFDALIDDVAEMVKQVPSDSLIVNLIGLIRHLIDDSKSVDSEKAVVTNSLFPIKLVQASEIYNVKILQIGTDCIYSGQAGSYVEGMYPTPIDLYGMSKALGEVNSKNLMTIRVSSVGHETKHHVELMDWVLGHTEGSTIKGFTNHLWNGITALHVGKIIEAVAEGNLFLGQTIHLLPANKISKFDLVSEIARLGGRNDLKVVGTLAPKAIDRTLSTRFEGINSNLWRVAGYQELPRIESLLGEYFDWCAN